MKVLRLTQPWASLVAIGAKKIETRSWGTKYRGPLAIHAAKGFPQDAQHLCSREPFRHILIEQYSFMASGEIYLGKHKFPLGAVVAVCNLVNVVQFGCMAVFVDPTGKEQIVEKYDCPEGWICVPPYNDANEFAFGDYTMGRYAFILADIRPLSKPISARGSLGLWEWQEK